jgi:hypothetical protein
MVNIGLNNGGINAHSASLYDTFLLCDVHNSLVNLLDNLRPESPAPAAHRLGIWHFGEAYAGEVAIDKIGPHFTLKCFIAPVADVLQDQQTQDHFRREAAPATRAAHDMALAESIIHGRQNLFVGQHFVDVPHPVFVKTFDFVRDQPVAEVELCAPKFNHALSSRALTRWHWDATAGDG